MYIYITIYKYIYYIYSKSYSQPFQYDFTKL